MSRLYTGRRVLATLFLTSVCLAQSSAHQSLIAGTWRGSSECVQSESPCHDEVNVYHFAEMPGKPGTFSGAADKMEDGKEVVMGTLEWTYDPDRHTLESKIPRGTFRLVVSGNKMEGTLRLTDNTLYRRIHLQRTQ